MATTQVEDLETFAHKVGIEEVAVAKLEEEARRRGDTDPVSPLNSEIARRRQTPKGAQIRLRHGREHSDEFGKPLPATKNKRS